MADELITIELLQEKIDSLNSINKSVKEKCSRLEILNDNLENQVKMLNEQLSKTVALLEKAENDNASILVELNELKEKSIKYDSFNKRVGDIITNAHGYAQSLIGTPAVSIEPDNNYVTKVNDLLGKISTELDVATQIIAKKK